MSSATPLKIGAIAYDTRQQAVGQVMEVRESCIYLRPLGGGLEWSPALPHVRAASPEEAAAARQEAYQR